MPEFESNSIGEVLSRKDDEIEQLKAELLQYQGRIKVFYKNLYYFLMVVQSLGMNEEIVAVFGISVLDEISSSLACCIVNFCLLHDVRFCN